MDGDYKWKTMNMRLWHGGHRFLMNYEMFLIDDCEHYDMIGHQRENVLR